MHLAKSAPNLTAIPLSSSPPEFNQFFLYHTQFTILPPSFAFEMPKAYNKVVKHVNKKKGSTAGLHEKSRDWEALNRATSREVRVKKAQKSTKTIHSTLCEYGGLQTLLLLADSLSGSCSTLSRPRP
jgi:hypothetical protein